MESKTRKLFANKVNWTKLKKNERRYWFCAVFELKDEGREETQGR